MRVDDHVHSRSSIFDDNDIGGIVDEGFRNLERFPASESVDASE